MIAGPDDHSVGFTDSHAFQRAVNNGFSSGLAYRVAYTYSKALDENDGWFGAEGKNAADPYNPRASLSLAGYDLPHILTGLSVKDVLYMPPMLARWVRDPIVGVWQPAYARRLRQACIQSLAHARSRRLGDRNRKEELS